MADLLNDVVELVEAVANTEAAEYTYKALDLLAPLAPEPFAGTVAALVKIARDFAADDEKRKAEVASILAEYQAKAQEAADKFDH